jgi:hypothetical protein
MFSQKSRRTTSTMKMILLQPELIVNNRDKITRGVFSTNSVGDKSNNFMKPTAISYRGSSSGMSWGGPTWTFLHTIVEKIKSEHFHRLRSELLKNIYMICTNLPCPDCSMHSKNYLNGINFNVLKNKSELKTMLYEFHNSVNLRKGNDLFAISNLNEKYNNQVLSVAFYNFLIKFKDRGANNRFIHEDIYRSQLSKDLVKWFNTNKEFFDE